MSWFTNALSNFFSFLKSDKAKQAVSTAAMLAEIAIPIVVKISAATPNKTLAEVLSAYQQFGVPFVSDAGANDPNALSNALLNLASSLLAAKLPPAYAGVASNVLHTAVQLAVTATKA